jgi:hypothetical protein
VRPLATRTIAFDARTVLKIVSAVKETREIDVQERPVVEYVDHVLV